MCSVPFFNISSIQNLNILGFCQEMVEARRHLSNLSDTISNYRTGIEEDVCYFQI